MIRPQHTCCCLLGSIYIAGLLKANIVMRLSLGTITFSKRKSPIPNLKGLGLVLGPFFTATTKLVIFVVFRAFVGFRGHQSAFSVLQPIFEHFSIVCTRLMPVKSLLYQILNLRA